MLNINFEHDQIKHCACSTYRVRTGRHTALSMLNRNLLVMHPVLRRLSTEEVHLAIPPCQKSVPAASAGTAAPTFQMYCRPDSPGGASERRPGHGHERGSPSREKIGRASCGKEGKTGQKRSGAEEKKKNAK